MKVALYIEDGLEQVVLTPETETERGIVGKLHEADRKLSVHRGGFYGCRGGWTRHKRQYLTYPGTPEPEDESTILVLNKVEHREVGGSKTGPDDCFLALPPQRKLR